MHLFFFMLYYTRMTKVFTRGEEMDCRTVQQKIMPYIERRLSDAELEEFLDHVQHCASCREELEVYFTIYYALQKLDSDDTDSFDMKEILRNDMEKMQMQLQKNESVRFMKKFFYVIVGMIIGIAVLVGTDALLHGGLQNTVLYQWIAEEVDLTEEETVKMKPLEIKPTEKEEPETNHKKEIIITVPETEIYMEPGPIPD